jgi:hypothetical protein
VPGSGRSKIIRSTETEVTCAIHGRDGGNGHVYLHKVPAKPGNLMEIIRDKIAKSDFY